MLKSWIFAAVSAAVAAGLGAAPAAAQTSNSMLATSGVMNRISASDVVSMMTDLGVHTQLTASEDGTPVLLASTDGGARFMFQFFGCDDQAKAVGCLNTIILAAAPSAGSTYDDLNAFNGRATVTTAVNLPEQQTILFGRNIIVAGGHSRDLFKATVYYFLRDVASFVNSRAGSASVAFEKPSRAVSKLTPPQAEAARRNPSEAFGITDYRAAVSTAIANTNDVDFSVNYAPGK